MRRYDKKSDGERRKPLRCFIKGGVAVRVIEEIESDVNVISKMMQQIYAWVDDIPLTRPKRNITRDFSDGGIIPLPHPSLTLSPHPSPLTHPSHSFTLHSSLTPHSPPLISYLSHPSPTLCSPFSHFSLSFAHVCSSYLPFLSFPFLLQ